MMVQSQRRPTLKNVAALAGVSIKTVSRVVNEEPAVAAETRAKVNRAVRELGYQQDHRASSLKRENTSATIGLVVADVANPFYSVVTRTIENEAFAAGHLLITVSSDEDSRREREVIDRLIQRRIDGLIIASARKDHRFLRKETEMYTSVVFLDRPPVRLAADAVLLDNRNGARLAAQHLIDQGHRSIGVLSDTFEDAYTAEERFAGFSEVMAEAGIPVDRTLVASGLHDPEHAAEQAKRMLATDNPPTAFFAMNNRAAVGAAQAIAGRANIGLVGFDDFELADALRRPVTVVSYDLPLMARVATNLLFERLAGFDGKPRTEIIPTRLVVRDG